MKKHYYTKNICKKCEIQTVRPLPYSLTLAGTSLFYIRPSKNHLSFTSTNEKVTYTVKSKMMEQKSQMEYKGA